MKKISFVLFCFIFFIQCTSTTTNGASKTIVEKNKDTIIVIKTSLGNVKVKLYAETPMHRDNFVKLVKEKFYNGTLFHRVIKGFMVQGGDPNSKKAKKGQRLGEGDLGYTIKPEFNNKYYHKKGALAAAREGDRANPDKKSSASQFYFATGKVYRNTELDSMVVSINKRRKRKIFMSLKSKNANKFKALQKANEYDKINQLITSMNTKLDSLSEKTKLILSDKQKHDYTSIGGTPHLDGNYTVFGEIIEGMDVIDKLSEQKTDSFDRPLKDIKMKMSIVKK